MNSLNIIGNLTKDPEQRMTTTGKAVTTFTVAVNRRGKENEADFFRVSAWEKQAENCARYLRKGRKVYVRGPVSVSTYTAQDGTTRANLEVMAQEVEFLTPKGETETDSGLPAGSTVVSDEEADLPF